MAIQGSREQTSSLRYSRLTIGATVATVGAQTGSLLYCRLAIGCGLRRFQGPNCRSRRKKALFKRKIIVRDSLPRLLRFGLFSRWLVGFINFGVVGLLGGVPGGVRIR